ncbi:MAG: phage tail protein [Dehalococcoidia bacterium]
MTSRSELAFDTVSQAAIPPGGPVFASPAAALARRQRGTPSMPSRARLPRQPVPIEGLFSSSYMQYLPGVFWSNEFLSRFLMIFESILDPIDRQVADLHHYFDPATSPREVLDWLASWWNLFLDESLGDERRRALVESAHEFFAWRGTRRGLAHLLKTTLGVEPEILEPTLAEVTQDPDRFAWRFTVRIPLQTGEPMSDDAIRRLVQICTPAGTGATVEIIRP